SFAFLFEKYRMKSIFTLLLAVVLFACNGQDNVLAPQDFKTKLEKTPNAVLLDVRTAGEFAEGYVNGARNLDWNSKFKTEVVKYNRDMPYFVYCLAGGRSHSAVEFMKSQGFTQVYEMQGGVMKWTGAGLPLSGAADAPADKISMEEYQKMGGSADRVLIDFYAPWCGPCRKLEPILSDLGKDGKVKVIRINIDENKQLAHALKFEEIPVLQFYSKGKLLKNHFGFLPKEDILKVWEK
ncbi:MAG: thioredoxin domain-containing protein, partial [Bacteroidia bacterium]